MNQQEQQALRALYRQTRNEQPSHMLDRRIRQAAMQQRQRRRPRWIWGLSMAAVLVLSFSLVLQLGVQDAGLPAEYEQDLHKPLSSTPHEPPESAPAPAFAPPGVPSSPSRSTPGMKKELLRPPRQLADEAEISTQASEQRLTESIQSLGAARTEDQASSRGQGGTKPAPMARVAPTPVTTPVLPTLPVQLLTWQAWSSALTVIERDSDHLEIVHQGRKIVDLKRSEQGTRFNAWRGSEFIGVKADWSVSRYQFGDCHTDSSYQVCVWDGDVHAVFDGARLDHIRWWQAQ
jgi:hypothetical protein